MEEGLGFETRTAAGLKGVNRLKGRVPSVALPHPGYATPHAGQGAAAAQPGRPAGSSGRGAAGEWQQGFGFGSGLALPRPLILQGYQEFFVELVGGVACSYPPSPTRTVQMYQLFFTPALRAGPRTGGAA